MVPNAKFDDASTRKAVLFCPQCGDRASWSEWVVAGTDHTLRCPSCGETVR